MIYINEPYLKLEWDSKDKLLYLCWSGFFSSKNFQTGLLKALDVIVDNQSTKVLVNIVDSKLVSLQDQDYLAHEWTPLAIEQGLRHIAYVVPKNVLTQMALDRIVNQTTGVEICYFQTEVEARQWLTSVPD